MERLTSWEVFSALCTLLSLVAIAVTLVLAVIGLVKCREAEQEVKDLLKEIRNSEDQEADHA